jgi:hypothetical protein
MKSETPDSWEVLKLDYEQSGLNFRILADIRFRLITLVPSITGAAVALLQNAAPESAFAGSLIGLVATIGIVRYELRNTQLYDASMQRLRTLERKLGFVQTRGEGAGGVHRERPDRSLKFLGLDVIHDRGLAFVYAAALGGWTFSLANAICELINRIPYYPFDVPGFCRVLGSALVGLTMGILTVREFKRIDDELEEVRKLHA